VDANPLREASRQAVKDLGLILAPLLRPALPPPQTVEKARADIWQAIYDWDVRIVGEDGAEQRQIDAALDALIAAVRAEPLREEQP